MPWIDKIINHTSKEKIVNFINYNETNIYNLYLKKIEEKPVEMLRRLTPQFYEKRFQRLKCTPSTKKIEESKSRCKKRPIGEQLAVG